MVKYLKLTKMQKVDIIYFKWTSESYTFQSSQELGNDVIKDGGLVCYVVYLN